ncbi:hypothetical protein A1O7_08312 [Cladophialophora yegresii CBS 114405]|uniref:Uncharacterized protein n=1 Tax=Cladophialophora yegresii CBS 114405 TaxID=1182544 RepID=W9VQV9_9EURO|nr:uncharacterized protein A1O7_08312 [Cladophialophora yegresii CBS 114405]EXJ55385.1 hypothetical protein A1O7_08312 [Cladophialophora yegresii CBS 114405]
MTVAEAMGETATNVQHTHLGANAPTEINARDLFSLDHRTIIVTGASGGMGLTVVKAILQFSADVIAVDCHEAASSAQEGMHYSRPLRHQDLQRIAHETNTHLTYHHCDISNLESTSSVFGDAVSRARYPLRGLVHCAAIGWTEPSINFPIEEAQQIVEVNLIGTLICAQAAATLVLKNGGPSASFVLIAGMSGYVVNKVRCVREQGCGCAFCVSRSNSPYGARGTPNAAYAASKAGVHQLTRNLASEWGSPCPQAKAKDNGGGGGGLNTARENQNARSF